MGVVNVKVNYIRAFGFENLKEWMDDPNNEYIGRRGVIFVDRKRFPKASSKWANPYKLLNQERLETKLWKSMRIISETK